MRISTIILTFILLIMVASVSAQSVTLFGGAYTMQNRVESFGDEWGYSAGALVGVNQHLGVYTSYEYQRLFDGMIDRFDLSTYLAVTLAKSTKVKLAGLVGFEWADTKMFGFEWDNPYVGIGGMAQYNIYNNLGAYGSMTTTMVDESELFDIVKARIGLTYSF